MSCEFNKTHPLRLFINIKDNVRKINSYLGLCWEEKTKTKLAYEVGEVLESQLDEDQNYYFALEHLVKMPEEIISVRGLVHKIEKGIRQGDWVNVCFYERTIIKKDYLQEFDRKRIVSIKPAPRQIQGITKINNYKEN